MKVLHLCSYYYGSTLYDNLVKSLDELDIEQEVYIPVIKGLKLDIQNFSKCNFIVKETYGSVDRAFFYKKYKQNLKGLVDSTDINKVDIIHAHTLFTNGVIAYNLKKEKGIPYIVAVRNSDVNTFFKYFIHLRKLGVNILKEAEKVIFISPAYLENTIEKYVPEKYRKEIREKSLVIPNGVNSYWIENKGEVRKVSDKLKLVYAGEITENKNVHKVIRDVKDMNDRGIAVNYTIIGEGPYKEKVESLIKELSAEAYITFLPRINDKKLLREKYKENDVFVMTSTFETFGLSYIEALSQGVPVLYTKNQGIDGFFKEGRVGFAVPLGESIQNYIMKIKDNYEEMSKNAIEIVDDFNWKSIGKKYNEIYKDISK